MSLHLKYRPKDFSELEGNQATVTALQTVFARESDFPHAILLTGLYGGGKTSIARIIAIKLGCFGMDLQEMDIGDMRGIDVARDIRQKMMFQPLESKCRVYILDEFHAATADFQKAMLKALEDTPKHVYFILCTTNPETINKGIQTRCMTFTVEPLPERNIVRLLKKVSTAEGVEIPEDVLGQIAKDCLGSARTALVILDKIIDLPPDKMAKAAEQKALEESTTLELCRALMDNRVKWQKIAGILKTLNDSPPEQIRRAVLGYCSACLMGGQENFRAFEIIETFKDNYFNTGKAGLVHDCFAVALGGK